jgi:hypothetical protein
MGVLEPARMSRSGFPGDIRTGRHFLAGSELNLEWTFLANGAVQ